MNAKKIAILSILGFCCITVIPIIILILDATDCYPNSTLSKLIKELE
jgi:hypothetical protein